MPPRSCPGEEEQDGGDFMLCLEALGWIHSWKSIPGTNTRLWETALWLLLNYCLLMRGWVTVTGGAEGSASPSSRQGRAGQAAPLSQAQFPRGKPHCLLQTALQPLGLHPAAAKSPLPKRTDSFPWDLLTNGKIHHLSREQQEHLNSP